jgi:hypothetical protein
MKVQISAPDITTFRKLLEKLVREEAAKRIASRRVRNRTMPPPAEAVEAQK